MVSQLNKEVLAKVSEIITYIKNTEEYKNYLQARKLLAKDQELNTLINNIKKYQQEIVKNPERKQELELKIQECLAILNTSPLYLEYETYQEEVNNLLTIFENKVNKYFEDVFNQVKYE